MGVEVVGVKINSRDRAELEHSELIESKEGERKEEEAWWGAGGGKFSTSELFSDANTTASTIDPITFLTSTACSCRAFAFACLSLRSWWRLSRSARFRSCDLVAECLRRESLAFSNLPPRFIFLWRRSFFPASRAADSISILARSRTRASA